MQKDRVLIKFRLPSPLPDLGIAVIKCAKNNRWTIFIQLVTAEATDGAYYYRYHWWLQVRAWCPPVSLFRGWIRAG